MGLGCLHARQLGVRIAWPGHLRWTGEAASWRHAGRVLGRCGRGPAAAALQRQLAGPMCQIAVM